MHERAITEVLERRLSENRRFMQIIVGPRQVGKTTLVQQVLKRLSDTHIYASADTPQLRDRIWLQQQWESARLKAATAGSAILVIDEVQKVAGWDETVKQLWDEDSVGGRDLKVVLLGSSQLLIQKGLTESLAGRFECIRVPHWSFVEMEQAFGWSVTEYIAYGGYPGAASLIEDFERWGAYIRDSLVETTVSRDIMLMTRIDKPALLRRLFDLTCEHSGQELAFHKMLGQLHDAGNTTTLAHYLALLDGAGLACGLQKYSGTAVRKRASSPKLQVHNMALKTSLQNRPLTQLVSDTERWGRWVESAIGAHLVNECRTHGAALYYWRDGDHEVDFVLENQGALIGLEVKSGARRTRTSGMIRFQRKFPNSRVLLVGGDGIPVAEFLRMSLSELGG
jgi:predicted AAA+ superfamily ATPase